MLKVRFISHFYLSLIGGLLGFWIGSYGDTMLNIDSQIFCLTFGAIIGGLLSGLRSPIQVQLIRAAVTAFAAGTPALYLVVQNRAIMPVAVTVMFFAGIGYLVVTSVSGVTKTLRQ
jgi:hypothetical protein